MTRSEPLAAAAVGASARADAEIICDYATGSLGGAVRNALLARNIRPRLGGGDAHDPSEWAALAPDLVTPNAEETATLLGMPLKRESDRAKTVAASGTLSVEATGAKAVVVTLDRDGTVLVDREGMRHRTWACPSADKQASGAGDTFAAALTIARACGLPLVTSADLARSAAHVVVTRFGTSVCSTTDLATHLTGFAKGALEQGELLRNLEQERTAGHRITMFSAEVRILDYLPAHSTTAVVNRIQGTRDTYAARPPAAGSA